MTRTHTATASSTGTRHHRADHRLAVATTGLAGLTYLGSRAAGADLAARTPESTYEVGFVSVLVTAAVVAVAGLALLRYIERRSAHGLRTWTLLASLIWLCSFLGPLGAADPASGVALSSLHLVVGAAVIVGAWWIRMRGVA